MEVVMGGADLAAGRSNAAGLPGYGTPVAAATPPIGAVGNRLFTITRSVSLLSKRRSSWIVAHF
jgi:hypothetical protein